MLRRFAVFMLMGMIIMPGTASSESVSLTLEQAVAMALRDNRDILLKSEDVKKAKLKIQESESALLPTLNFTGGWTDTRGYYSKDIGQVSTQLGLKQYLYKGGKTINTIKFNGYNFEIAESLLDKMKLEVVLNVKTVFYTMLLSAELVNLNKNILKNTEQHLEYIKQRYSKGEAADSELLNMKASLVSVRKAYEESVNQMESARDLLGNLLYLDRNALISPEAEFIYDAQEIAFDEAFLRAMQFRPEIRQYEAQEQAGKKSFEIAKADSRPSIYASWDYYARSHLAAGTTKNWNDYNIIGFTFNWPVFDGWLTKSKVEQAIVDLKETRLVSQKNIRDIASELKHAYLSLKNAIAEIKSVEAAIGVYKDTLRMTEEKYQSGLASSLDLDDASLRYSISLFNQNEAVYDYIIAKARFDKATGGL